VQADLIITDMQMPKMGGAELIDVLRAQPNTANIPIVVVASRQSKFEEGEKSADFAIFKDIDIQDQLAKALEKTMGPFLAKDPSAGK
jgi:CheY-like chemotaxis protein